VNEHISEVHAEVNAMGRGKITVDGQDVSDKVSGFQVVVEPRTVPQVLLYPLNAEVDLTLDAEVQVVQQTDDVPAWLDGLDVDVLEQLAIHHGVGQSTGRGFIEALKELWSAR
jgi:hypothetical protein